MSFPSGPEELSATWMRQALAEVGEAWAGEIDELRAEVIGVGFGLDGTLARVTTVGPRRTEATLVAKWCRAAVGVREARFYRDVGPHLGLDLPRLLAACVEGEQALLLLEDVRPSRQGDAILGAAPQDAGSVLEVVGGFHARFWSRLDDPAVAWLPRWGGDVAGEAERTRARLQGFFERWGSSLSPGLRALAERLPEAVVAAHGALADAPATVLHGDLHLDNVLFRPDGTPVVIDWATAARGPAAVDVVRFLTEGLTLEARRALEGPLLARYLRAMSDRGIRYESSALRTHLDDALIVLFGAAIRSKDPASQPTVARLLPIIENLVRNVTGALEDRLHAGLGRRYSPGA